MTYLESIPVYNGMVSVVDYVIASEKLVQLIPLFNVGDFIPWLSDHSPLRFTLELYQTNEREEEESNMQDMPKQFIWTEDGIAKFQKEPNKTENIQNIDNIM